MLRIEKNSGGCVTRLRLSGRIQADQVASIQSEMGDGCTTRILDLSEVTLVDLGVIRFLIRCADEGVAITQCPPYILEWMIRERVEGTQPDPADGG